MKKIKILLIGLFLVLCLTGCGEKKLLCTDSEKKNGLEFKTEYLILFKKDKINTAKVTFTVDVSDEDYKKEWSTFVNEIERSLSIADLKGKTGFKVNSSENKNKGKYQATINIDLTKAERSDASKLYLGYSLDDDYGTYAEVKEDLESFNFTCK